MEKEKILLELNNQAKTIKAHISRLKRNERNIHMLDIDMLRDKTIDLYEMVSELEQLIHNSSEIKADQTPEVIPPTIENPAIEPPVIEEPVNDIEDVRKIEKVILETIPETIEQEIIEEDVIIEESPIPESVTPTTEETPVVEPKPEPVETAPQVEEIIQESIVVDIVEQEEPEIVETKNPQIKQTTYDLFSENTESPVAERFQVGEEQNIAERMQKTSISNIREAIGINEKFLFINELFNGDLGRYNKILDDINELSTKKGVDTYLLELKIQFQWADDNEAYVKLKDLLDRKLN